ncbi:nitrate- and nitrite sensing domain-containing protein [Microbispora sp. NPDC049125]|uniref:sensor histidine kinase n=1 Tax=Microbispora sp. NPDC049125 TaxID=3154929 RepID=UPI0034653153
MWGFVLKLTVGDGLVLLRAKSVYDTIGVPSTDLGLQIQAERAITAGLLSSGQRGSSALTAQQAKTSAAVDMFKKNAGDESARASLGEAVATPLDSLLTSLDRLPSIRESITLGKFDRLQAIKAYNGLMDELFALYERLVSVPDLAVFQQASAMQGMGNAHEMIAREDALVRGAIASGHMSQGEQNAFSEWVATRRFLYSKNRPVLTGGRREPYEQVLASPLFDRFAGIEDRIVDQVRAGGALPSDSDKWAPTVDALVMRLDAARVKSSDALTADATSVASGIIARIAIAGGLGLVVILTTIIFSVRFGRRLARDLAGLRDAALDLADVRLPQVVDALRRGEEVDVETEAPPIRAGGSAEVEDVAQAFSSVQRTAVEAAVGQANLRRGVNQVFLNLARRKQTLLHRQLTLLDDMQRRADDPESLDDLFRLDHLTTRMRRHAEGLIILSGATPGRAWRKPVPLIDVVRAAVAEVEDYTRISLTPMPNASIAGATVADIVHLIAELLENATIFSPPQTKVQVRGEVVANGVVVEIEDRGLGLTPEEYTEINARLASPPEFDLADSDRLGLFVVGRLAERHDIRVILRNSPYGGTTAIVLVPRSLVADDGSPAPISGSATRVSGGAHAKRALTSAAHDASAPSEAEPAGPGPDRPVPVGLGGISGPTTGSTTNGSARPRAVVNGLTDTSDDPLDGPLDGPLNGRIDGPVTGSGLPSRRRLTERRDATDRDTADRDTAGRDLADDSGDSADGDGTVAESSPFFTPASLRTEAVPSAARDDLPPASMAPAVPGQPAVAGEPVSTAMAGTDDLPRSPAVPRPKPSRSSGTHAGLPRRVRQANIAPQLRGGQQPQAAAVADPVHDERSPEEARATFSAFQRGARRGREDAEQPESGAPSDHVHNTHGEKGEE